MAHPLTLGKYTIEGVLGSGAMGMVYKATDPVIQRPVALKTIHKSLVDGDDAVASMAARFRNEAKAAGRMSHPGIVQIYEYGEDGDTAFIAMEFIEGQDLSKVLATTPALPEPALLQIMDHLLAALDYAHQRGVWHRDIKPANLILTQSGHIKIADFGIARIRDASLTQVTSTIGTHGYMAPEQYTGQDIDHRVDIFASGVLLYRLLTGQAPFAGSPEQTMYKVLHEAPPPPSSHTQIPRSLQLDAVVAKALAKDAAQRYATAGAFREALQRHASQATPNTAAPLDDATIVIGSPAPITFAAFDTEMLNHVEKSLASFVGPLAKLLVKQAATANTDFHALLEAVAQHVSPDEERARFLAKVMGVGSSATPVPTTARATTVVQLSEGLVAHATRVLTSHMGPIARVVIKKALAQSRNADQFFESLIALSADGVDRDKLRAELRQGTQGTSGLSGPSGTST